MNELCLRQLPEHLAERVRVHCAGPETQGAFVLYWVRNAMRSEENPALDVAQQLALQLDLPLAGLPGAVGAIRVRVRSPPYVHPGRHSGAPAGVDARPVSPMRFIWKPLRTVVAICSS